MVLRLPVAVAGSDLGFLKEMALCGAGITILPRLSVQRELDDGRLVHILPSYVWPSAGLFLLHRGGPFVAPKIRAFLDYLRTALSPNAPARRRPAGSDRASTAGSPFETRDK
ncbi:MAG: hypothetical protein H7138_17480 [Myxococcales bacterium]|nr:hypothetical protein [Myxococcales bacterium]